MQLQLQLITICSAIQYSNIPEPSQVLIIARRCWMCQTPGWPFVCIKEPLSRIPWIDILRLAEEEPKLLLLESMEPYIINTWPIFFIKRPDPANINHLTRGQWRHDSTHDVKGKIIIYNNVAFSLSALFLFFYSTHFLYSTHLKTAIEKRSHYVLKTKTKLETFHFQTTG